MNQQARLLTYCALLLGGLVLSSQTRGTLGLTVEPSSRQRLTRAEVAHIEKRTSDEDSIGSSSNFLQEPEVTFEPPVAQRLRRAPIFGLNSLPDMIFGAFRSLGQGFSTMMRHGRHMVHNLMQQVRPAAPPFLQQQQPLRNPPVTFNNDQFHSSPVQPTGFASPDAFQEPRRPPPLNIPPVEHFRPPVAVQQQPNVAAPQGFSSSNLVQRPAPAAFSQPVKFVPDSGISSSGGFFAPVPPSGFHQPLAGTFGANQATATSFVAQPSSSGGFLAPAPSSFSSSGSGNGFISSSGNGFGNSFSSSGNSIGNSFASSFGSSSSGGGNPFLTSNGVVPVGGEDFGAPPVEVVDDPQQVQAVADNTLYYGDVLAVNFRTPPARGVAEAERSKFQQAQQPVQPGFNDGSLAHISNEELRQYDQLTGGKRARKRKAPAAPEQVEDHHPVERQQQQEQQQQEQQQQEQQQQR